MVRRVAWALQSCEGVVNATDLKGNYENANGNDQKHPLLCRVAQSGAGPPRAMFGFSFSTPTGPDSKW